jgi:hypothetical protein
VRQVLQRARRLVDLDDALPPSRLRRREPTLDDGADCAALERLGHECMPVEPLSAERDEKIARLQRPRIRDDISNLAVRIAGADRTRYSVCDPSERQPKLVTQPAT